MGDAITEVLHVLIDVAAGIRSAVGEEEGKRLHELVTPPPDPAVATRAELEAKLAALDAEQASGQAQS